MGCADCGTTDPALHYRSGRMTRCYDCQNFANLSTKSTGGGVHFSREEFLDWKRVHGRTCDYCGMGSGQLYSLAIVNPRDERRYESIGVDRIDNASSYTLTNIVACCGPCNAIESGILTHSEMTALSSAVRAIWDTRLRASEATL